MRLLKIRVFFQNLQNGFLVCKVNNIVFVVARVSSDLLVRSISPISINFEFVHVLHRVKEFDDVMSGLLLSNPILKVDLSKASASDWLTRDDAFHFLTLPLVELSTDLNILSAE